MANHVPLCEPDGDPCFCPDAIRTDAMLIFDDFVLEHRYCYSHNWQWYSPPEPHETVAR